jgi:hypothetical protein
MEIEYTTKVFVVDEATLQNNIKQMLDEGWAVIPGAQAVAVFPVQRIKQALADIGGVGGMSIDESKIKILRNGQLIDG